MLRPFIFPDPLLESARFEDWVLDNPVEGMTSHDLGLERDCWLVFFKSLGEASANNGTFEDFLGWSLVALGVVGIWVPPVGILSTIAGGGVLLIGFFDKRKVRRVIDLADKRERSVRSEIERRIEDDIKRRNEANANDVVIAEKLQLESKRDIGLDGEIKEEAKIEVLRPSSDGAVEPKRNDDT